MSTLAEMIAKALAKNRSGCWCEDTRKPCGYHEGCEDGADLAEQAVQQWLASDEVRLTLTLPYSVLESFSIIHDTLDRLIALTGGES